MNHQPLQGLLFKGGTSLSKGDGLIERFSEDIDITVFRDDIGQSASVEELEALSGKKRAAMLESIRAACQEYINGALLTQITTQLAETLTAARIPPEEGHLELDLDDQDHQSLLLWHPTMSAPGNDYIRCAIKIESSAKSAHDPHSPIIVKPYVDDDLPELEYRAWNSRDITLAYSRKTGTFREERGRKG